MAEREATASAMATMRLRMVLSLNGCWSGPAGVPAWCGQVTDREANAKYVFMRSACIRMYAYPGARGEGRGERGNQKCAGYCVLSAAKERDASCRVNPALTLAFLPDSFSQHPVPSTQNAASVSSVRLEIHRDAIDPVAQMGRRRAILEDVYEMAAAGRAMHFSPDHAVGFVNRGFG